MKDSLRKSKIFLNNSKEKINRGLTLLSDSIVINDNVFQEEEIKKIIKNINSQINNINNIINRIEDF